MYDLVLTVRIAPAIREQHPGWDLVAERPWGFKSLLPHHAFHKAGTPALLTRSTMNPSLPTRFRRPGA